MFVSLKNSPGRISTVGPLGLLLVCSALAGCNKNVSEGEHLNWDGSSGQELPVADTVAAGPSIEGTITLPAGATVSASATLFLIARSAEGGMPLAVRKYDRPSFPLAFRLDSSHVMVQGRPFSGDVMLQARLDGDGNATTRQEVDLVGVLQSPVPVGTTGIQLLLNSALESASQASAAPGAQSMPGNAAPAPSGNAVASASGSLEGWIQLAPEVEEQAKNISVLFLIARRPGERMPLAVQKISAPSFPLQFRMTAKDSMVPGSAFEGEVVLTARLDRDGSAGPAQTGDIEGTSSTIQIGQNPVKLMVDRPIP